MSGDDQTSLAQLQLLLAELKRIEGQQQQLKTAAAENKVLIVHPIEGVILEEEDDDYAVAPEAKADPDLFVPSGGLTGFEVAKDLMKINFSPPSEAPEEFRALNFVAPPALKGQGRPALLASAIYSQGSFGAMDPASHDLYMFLEKLQEQQKEVVALIKARQDVIARRAEAGNPTASPQPLPLPPTTSPLRPVTERGNTPSVATSPTSPSPASRFGPAAQSEAQAQATKLALAAAANAALGPSPVSEADAKKRKALDAKQAGGAGLGAPLSMVPGGQLTALAMQAGIGDDAEITQQAMQTSTTGQGTDPSNKPSHASASDKEDWRQPVPINMEFGVKWKQGPRHNRPARASLWGRIIFMLYIGSFLFYAYCRCAHTMDRRDKAFAYQVIFAMLEVGSFISGVLFGLCQLSRLQSEKPHIISEMAHRLRGASTSDPDVNRSNGEAGRVGVVDIDARAGVQVSGKTEARLGHRRLDKQVAKPINNEQPHKILKGKYHVQILVWSSTDSMADAARCRAALLAAHHMVMPEGPGCQACTRIIYLIDPIRDQAKMELVREIALDGVLYMPGPEEATSVTDLSKAACLNRVLRKIYPRGTEPKATDLVAFFDDDQIAHPEFLCRTVPALEELQVRLAHTRPGLDNLSAHSDVFNQAGYLEHTSQIPGYEALGCVAPSPSAFVVRADALQKCNWEPTYSRASHVALGQELKLQGFLSHYVPEVLAVGLAPDTIARVYHAKQQEAQGLFQVFYHARPAHALRHLSLVIWLLYSAQAFSNQWAALLMPVWLAVPLVQVIFDVFPFNPNRWFGLGFLVYWCFATPLLYKCYRWRHARGLWHYTCCQQNLWATYLTSLVKTWRGSWRARAGPVVQDMPANARTVKGQEVALEGPTGKTKQGMHTDPEQGDAIAAGNATALQLDSRPGSDTQRYAQHAIASVPWMSLLLCKVCASFLAAGCWLLFGTQGPQGNEQAAVSMQVLASNLPLVLANLWLLYHTVIFATPVVYAALAPSSYPSQHIKTGKNLAVASAAAGLPAPRTQTAEQVLSIPSTAQQPSQGAGVPWRGIPAGLRSGLAWQPGYVMGPLRFPISLRAGHAQAPPAAANALAATDSVNKRAVTREAAKRQGLGCLGVWSYLAWGLCWAAVLLAMIACLGLGSGKVGSWPAYKGSVETDYHSLLAKSLEFYQAQQSGVLNNNPIPWRSSSGLADLPQGGWYEGGSNLKLTFPTAIAATQLAWGMLAAPEGYSNSPSTSAHLASLQWAVDYLMACRPSSNQFVAQVGAYDSEMSTWERPEDMTTPRSNITITAAQPGADLVANAAAALAAASLLWASQNDTYAVNALIAAKDLYSFAVMVPGVYSDAYADAGLTYPSTSYLDDMAYAAAWMYGATKETSYLQEAQDYYNDFIAESGPTAPVNNWDNQFYAASLLLWQLTGDTVYQDRVEYFMTSWRDGSNGILYLSTGLAYSDANGSALRNTVNAAFLALLYRLGNGPYTAVTYSCWARGQIQHLVGQGPNSAQSFIVGSGSKAPLHAAHRAASCADSVRPCAGELASSNAYSATSANPHVLNGALVSGSVNSTYIDARSNSDNSVSVELNSAFAGAIGILNAQSWDVCSKRNGLLDQTGHHVT